MAAAYTAFVSLLHVLNRVQHHSCPASFDNFHIQSLVDKVGFLVDFLESCSQRISKDFERRLIEAAFAAEDMIETRIVVWLDAMSTGDGDQYFAFFYQELKKVVQEMDLHVHEAMEVKDNKEETDQQSGSSVRHVGSILHSHSRTKMVGFDEELIRLMDKLTSDEPSREIISVVGMGGTGKTTLATNLYNHPFVVNHFHVRAWATISHDFNIGEVVYSLLRDIDIDFNVDEVENDTESLLNQLHKVLFGRKYFIILDDIWSSLPWDEIRRFMPDNSNGSRILLTTRLLNVAFIVGSSPPYEMKFLNDDKSWDLLSVTVFGQEVVPSELQKYGEEIAKNCQGLPLAIVVIGGLLKMSDSKPEYWAKIAENTIPIISREDDEHWLNILSLSYHQLPIHLKPCFLHMAAFPEEYEIHASRLIMLWSAEGFLKPTTGKSLEEVALGYLNDLIQRNLVAVKERSCLGEMKYLTIHGLTRSVCLREAQKDNFLYIMKEDSLDCQETIDSHRRFVVHGSQLKTFPSIQAMRLVRSMVSFSNWLLSPYMQWSLVRVLIVPRQSHLVIRTYHNLRLLTFSMKYREESRFFSSLSFLWNLETLAVDGVPEGYTLPSEIWDLQHIQHLSFRPDVTLPDPPGDQIDSVLNSLQTLGTIQNLCFSDKVFSRIPNLKKLGIFYSLKDMALSPCFSNLVHFQKLETLKCSFWFNKYDDLFHNKCHSRRISNELKTLKLPPNLRKLTLYNSQVPWENMSIVGSLPNLEVLKLKMDAFTGKEWQLTEGQFQRLKYLSIAECYLVTWITENCSAFPALEHLELTQMWHLEAIPQVFGELNMIESIKMFNCSVSAVRSAKEILEEQQNQGNDDLIVKVRQRRGVEMIELESLQDDNFHVTLY